MKNLIPIIVVMLFIQGCPTPYQKKSTRSGYSETQLDENVFNVSFSGNSYTDREEVVDFTLLRSAELTLENGFQYFAIIDKDNDTTYRTIPQSSTYYTRSPAYYGTTITSIGGDTRIISKPSALNTIVCFEEKPEFPFTYNAKFIYKSVREKYDIKDE